MELWAIGHCPVRVSPAIAGGVSAWAGRTPDGAVAGARGQWAVAGRSTIRLDPEQPGQVVSVTRLEGPSLRAAAVSLRRGIGIGRVDRSGGGDGGGACHGRRSEVQRTRDEAGTRRSRGGRANRPVAIQNAPFR